MLRMRSLYAIVLLFGLAAGSHDATRENPLDPLVSPPVTLTVSRDDTSGTATLRWSTYQGQAPFGAYVVTRRLADRVSADTLAMLADAGVTAFVDSTLLPERTYSYRVLMSGTSGFVTASPAVNVRLVPPPAVRIEALVLNAHTASASLRWTEYVGGGFQAYRVQRQSADSGQQPIAEITNIAATSMVDTGLLGDTEYSYSVDVVTTSGLHIRGEPQFGSIHPVVQTWPLDLEADGQVRLYSEPDGIAALVTSPHHIRLYRIDDQGTLTEPQTLLEIFGFVSIAPASVAMALRPDGSRYLALSTTHAQPPFLLTTWMMRFDADNQAVRSVTPLFTQDIPDPLPDDAAPVLGTVRMAAFGNTYAIDSVHISSGARSLMTEKFASDELAEDWITSHVPDPFYLDQADGWLWVSGVHGDLVSVQRSDPAWTDFRLNADVMLVGDRVSGSLGLQIGRENPRSSAFTLTPDLHTGEFRLSWFQPPRSRSEFSTPYSFVRGAIYGLGLGVEDSRFSAWIEDPVFWAGPDQGGAATTSLSFVESFIVLSVDNQPHNLTQDAEVFVPAAFEVPVSETRSWRSADGDPWLGVSLPLAHEVRLHRLSGLARGPAWPTSGTILRLGSGLGHGNGEFAYPLSFDVGPDHRAFVLDAGNGRIQVFDAGGDFLTEWGRKGSHVGEFDFGSGSSPEDFAGSIAVDDEGFIYVADVGNRRIQKFAP